jgi:hypothetical protein
MLKGGKDIPVWETRIAVRMAERAHIAERSREPWVCRIPQIEPKRSTRVKPIGPQHTRARHLVLSVVGSSPGGTDRQRRDDGGIGGTARIDVDDSQEVAIHSITVARPNKEKATVRRARF